MRHDGMGRGWENKEHNIVCPLALGPKPVRGRKVPEDAPDGVHLYSYKAMLILLSQQQQ